MPIQHNSNIAFAQGGNDMILGAASGLPVTFNWEDLLFALAGGSPNMISWFDDFHGDALKDEYTVNVLDTATDATVVVDNGTLNIATSVDDESGASVGLAPSFSLAEYGTIIFQVRYKFALGFPFTNSAAFGLMDAESYTGVLPIVSGGGSEATNGVLYADSFVPGAIAINDGGTPSALSLVPVDIALPDIPDNTQYQTARIVLNSDGDATFYTNGVAKGKINNAVAPDVVLSPYISVLSETPGTANTLNVDYVGYVGVRR